MPTTARLTVAVALLLALSAGVPAAAQISPTASGFSGIREGSRDEYWLALRELGRCLVTYKRAQSVRWMQTPADSAEEKALVRAMYGYQGTRCLRDMYSMTVVRSTVRGSVAEALYKTSGPRGAAPQPPAPRAAPTTEVKSLDDFGRCYVALHPAEAHALLMTTPLGSPAEKAEFNRLAPGFGECFPAGVVLQLSAVPVRAAMAEALFAATNQGVGPAAGGQ